MKLHHLYHYKIGADEDAHYLFGEEGELEIGIFSSEAKALQIAGVLKSKPGFRK